MNNFNKKLFRPYFNFKKRVIILIKKMKTHKIIEKYFDEHQLVKIHLGCGGRIFDNWLNCDINLQSDCYVDLNKPLPFKDNSVDYIYSEHVLEHFDYIQGEKIVRECWRILKPGGIMRTSMPDLDFYLKNISNDKDSQIQDFIVWHQNNFLELKKLPTNMNTMLNFIIGSCGHKYIYLAQTFIDLLKKNNFKNVQQVEVGKSNYLKFDYLENNLIGRSTDVQNHVIQTMTFEANK